MVARAFIGAAALLAVMGAADAGARVKTDIAHWSPLDAASQIKAGLEVRNRSRGSCQFPGSEALGAIGFRCGAGNFIFDPCWREGAGPADHVVCASSPWATKVTRVRVPGLSMLGVEYGVPQHRFPWGIELAHGDRCTLLQGAHSTIPTGHGRVVVDYACRSGLWLLRNIRRRGGSWTIGAARYRHRTWTRLGRRHVRRAIFGKLPPAQARQRVLAHEAIAPARRAVRRKHPGAKLPGVDWVRLNLPSADRARVRFFGRGFRLGPTVTLHRAGNRWVE